MGRVSLCYTPIKSGPLNAGFVSIPVKPANKSANFGLAWTLPPFDDGGRGLRMPDGCESVVRWIPFVNRVLPAERTARRKEKDSSAAREDTDSVRTEPAAASTGFSPSRAVDQRGRGTAPGEPAERKPYC